MSQLRAPTILLVDDGWEILGVLRAGIERGLPNAAPFRGELER